MNSGVYGHCKAKTLTAKTKYLMAKANTSRQKQKLTARGKTRGKSKYVYCTRAWRREAWNPRFSQRMLGLGANPAWRHSMSDIHPKSRIIKPSKKLLVLMSSGKREGNICLILVQEVIRKEILNNTYNKHWNIHIYFSLALYLQPATCTCTQCDIEQTL